MRLNEVKNRVINQTQSITSTYSKVNVNYISTKSISQEE